MIDLKNKDLDKLFKLYKTYKQAQMDFEVFRDEMCKDLALGKYISKLGILNKVEGYSKVIDKERFAADHPDINLQSYEKKTPYSSIRIKLNI